MAHNTFDLTGTLGINISPFNRGLRVAHIQLQSFESSLNSTRSVVSGLFSGLALGAGAALAASIKTAISFESQMANVRKTTNLSGDELKAFQRNMEDLSLTMAGVPLNTLNDIAAAAGKLGITGVGPLTEFTKAVAMIGVAIEDLNPAQTAEKIGRILNQFQLGTDQTLAFASALNKLDDTSTASAADILTLTNELGKTSSFMKLTAQQTLALAGAMLDAGVKANQGGTAFGTLFKKMATAPEKFAQLIGVTTEEFMKLRDNTPYEAIKRTIRALADTKNASEALVILDGMKMKGEKVSSTLTALAQTADQMDASLATANSEWESHASITAENALRAETTAAKLQVLGNLIAINANEIGSHFLPSIKGMTDSIVTGREKFDELKDSFGIFLKDSKSGQMITGTLDSIGKAFSGMGITVPGILDDLGFAMRNWDEITESAGLDIYQALTDIPVIMQAVGSWIGDNWVSMFKDAFSMVLQLIKNFGKIALDQFQAYSKIITDLVTNPASILTADFTAFNPVTNFEKMFDMSKVEMKTPAFKMPELDHKDYDKQKAALAARIVANEKDAADKKAKRKKEREPEQNKPAVVPQKAKRSAEDEEPSGDNHAGGLGGGGHHGGKKSDLENEVEQREKKQRDKLENLATPTGVRIADLAANAFHDIKGMRGRQRQQANAYTDVEIRRTVGEALANDPSVSAAERRSLIAAAPGVYRRQFAQQEQKRIEQEQDTFNEASPKERQFINQQRRELGMNALRVKYQMTGAPLTPEAIERAQGVLPGFGKNLTLGEQGGSGKSGDEVASAVEKGNTINEQMLAQLKELNRKGFPSVLA